MLIYRALNLVNGKSYIGQTTRTLEKRRKEHERESKKLISTSKKIFHEALFEFGFDKWEWSILEECNSLDELDRLEIEYIKKYDTFVGSTTCNGYNVSRGGSTGYSVRYHPYGEQIIRKSIESHLKEMIVTYPDGEEVYIKGIYEFAQAHNLQGSLLRKVQQGKEKQHRGFKARNYDPEKDSYISKWDGSIKNVKDKRDARYNYDLHVIHCPNNEEYIISSVYQFAKVYDLQGNKLVEVEKGVREHHKGFVLRCFDEVNDKDITVWAGAKKDFVYDKKAFYTNPKIKKFIVIFPTNREMVVKGLNKFARYYNLNSTSLGNVLIGKQSNHKGFKARQYDPNKDYMLPDWNKEGCDYENTKITNHRQYTKDTIKVIITFPDNNEVYVDNISHFALSYNLDVSTLYQLLKGNSKRNRTHHKKYKIRLYNPISDAHISKWQLT